MADEKRQIHSHSTDIRVPARKRSALRLAVISAALVLYSLSLLNSQTSTYIWSFASGLARTSNSNDLPGTVTWWSCGDRIDCGTMMYALFVLPAWRLLLNFVLVSPRITSMLAPELRPSRLGGGERESCLSGDPL